MILVTGGAGYIGSHTVWLCYRLAMKFWYWITFVIASRVFESCQAITGKVVPLVQGMCVTVMCYGRFFVHMQLTGDPFRRIESGGESVEQPLIYYDNNVSGSVVLAEVMAELASGCWCSVLLLQYMAILPVCRLAKISAGATNHMGAPS